MSDDIAQLSIKELLNEGVDYIIPMYQRNFAWEEGEITQLIQDVMDYMPEGRNYYIGTLVVFERQNFNRTVYETIDGQQRLTTLSLLASYLKNRKNKEDGDFTWYNQLKIHFESRKRSHRTFVEIFKGNFENDPSEVLGANEINTAILNGYRLIQKILPQKLKENKLSCQNFAEYLFEMVQIMRVKVPHDTDLNHYFEIMNSRGEQLEKHEVLKSRMLEVLQGIEDVAEREMSQNCLHLVWEACANMERYVQMGFTPKQRSVIFGDKDWGRFDVPDFDALQEKLKASRDDYVAKKSIAQTLDAIITQAQGVTSNNDKDDESPERFNTVINFPNFLLNVLRVVSNKDDPLYDIPLDDKRLLTTFEEHLIKTDKAKAIERVKKFTFGLLRCKYLFDQYVIKREFVKGTDGWSLKRFKWNEGGEKNRSGRGSYVNTFGDDDETGGDNRSILMLLSAFHVSTPTMVYKHWLNAALYHLFYTQEISTNAYLRHLESVAKAFVFDRFLAPNGGADYFDMIYKNKGNCKTQRKDVSDDSLNTLLSFDQIENNLIFNYLDYLLWLENDKKDNKDSIVSAYEFTFRSSVEHYYPQNPMLGHDSLPHETLNSFGNLCLISHSKNSRLSNFMPEAKKEHYRSNTIDSVKQHLMMEFKNWDEGSIAEHSEAMKNVILDSLDSGKKGST
jgi:hypothetical protein